MEYIICHMLANSKWCMTALDDTLTELESFRHLFSSNWLFLTNWTPFIHTNFSLYSSRDNWLISWHISSNTQDQLKGHEYLYSITVGEAKSNCEDRKTEPCISGLKFIMLALGINCVVNYLGLSYCFQKLYIYI